MLLDGYEDIFRNEYTDVLCEALEIQRLEAEMALEGSVKKDPDSIELDEADFAYVLGDEDDDPDDDFEYDDASDPEDAEESLQSALLMLKENHELLIATEGIDPAFVDETEAIETFAELHTKEVLSSTRVLSTDEKIDAILSYYKECGCKFFIGEAWREETTNAHANYLEDPKLLRCSEETRLGDIPVIKMYYDGKLCKLIAYYGKNDGTTGTVCIDVSDPSSVNRQYSEIEATRIAERNYRAVKADVAAKRYDATSGIPAAEATVSDEYEEPALESAIGDIYAGMSEGALESTDPDDLDDDDEDLDDDIDLDDDFDDDDLDLDDDD